MDKIQLNIHRVIDKKNEFDKLHKVDTQILENRVTKKRYFRMSKGGIHIIREVNPFIIDESDCIRALNNMLNLLKLLKKEVGTSGI